MSKRKPHNENAGYVAERRCRTRCGGHIVIYDRERGAEDIDADERWVVMHEPSSIHVAVRTRRMAYRMMNDAAEQGMIVLGHDVESDGIWAHTALRGEK